MRQVKYRGLEIEVPKGSAFGYDTPPPMPKGHMLSIAVGKRGSGKSTAIINLIKNMKYDRIFVISPTFKSNSSLMKMLNVEEEDVFENPDDISCVDAIVNAVEKERDDLVDYQEKMKKYRHFLSMLNSGNRIPDELLLEFYSGGNFMAPTHKWGGKRPFMCLLVDDCQGTKLFTSRKLDNLTIRHRHVGAFDDDQPSIGISIAYLVQNYKSKSGGISRAIRNNITNAILFKNKDEKELDFIASELSGEIDKDMFMKMYQRATDEPFSFLFVDLHPKDIHPSGFRKNFNVFLVPE